MQRLPIFNRFFTKPKPAKIDDGSDIIAWELHPNGRINAIKQGSGWYGSGVGMGPGAFTETAVGAGIALTQSTYGWGAAYSQSTWVYRCVEVRKQAINRMPFYVYDKRTGKRIPDHPLLIAIAHSKQAIFKKIEQSQILFGETFLEPAKNEYGYYSTIYWLNNLGMAVLIGAGHVTGYSYTALQGGQAQQYDYDDLAFMKTDNPFNDLRGMSMLEVAMDEIRIDFDVARVVRAYYANDTRVGLLLIPTKDLSQPDSERFIEMWKMQNQGVDKAGKPVLMPYDMKVERVQNPMTLDDMNLRESTRREICGALGVPLSLAGGWDDAKYQSLPEQRKSFYEETIIPECENIADFINIDLMPFYEEDERSVFAYDFTIVLALTEDAQRKGDMYSQRLTSGGITRAEYRQALGHQAKPEDEVYYIPAGVTVVPAKSMELVKPQTNLVTTSPQAEQQVPALPSGAPPVKPNSEAPGGTDTQTEQSAQPHKQLPGNVFNARAPQPTIPPQLIPGKGMTIVSGKTNSTTIQVKQETAEEELTAWEKKAINNNPAKALAFTCFVTPGDVQAVVREALKALGKDAPKAAIRAVFRTARETMKANLTPPVAAFDYWAEFDTLQNDTDHSWLVDYMMAALSSLTFPDNQPPGPNDIQAILDMQHSSLMDNLLGTDDNPGSLVKLILAGMAAGNAAILHGSAANPQRPMMAKALDVNWDLMAHEARDKAKSYIYSLIKNVDSTTIAAVQDAVTRWIESGEGLDKLKEMLTPIFQDEARAQLIAQTESTRAYAEGSLERYRRAEIKLVEWKTVNDSVVCPTCEELRTQPPQPVDQGFKTAKGDVVFPPAHPGCRCWLRPSLEEDI